MATLGNYFINGPTLAQATAVFIDAALTTCAPDGFYSDGATVRQQSGCVLGIVQTCPACLTPCNQAINAGGNDGLFNVAFATGTDTGCVIIYFDPAGVPDGIRATYNGQTFNELTSPQFGYLASTDSPNHFTFIGSQGSDCGIGAQLAGGGYSGLNVRNWDGTQFVLVGTNGQVTGGAGDVQLTAGQPGYSTLYIPKPNATPDGFAIEMFGPCGGTVWAVEINCPVKLTGVPTGIQGSDCLSGTVQLGYNVPNRGGTAGEPALREFYCTDENGSNRFAAGTYRIGPPSGNKVITVDANGVIINIQSC